MGFPRVTLSYHEVATRQRALRFREKGGKVREIPVRHDLDAWLRAYLDATGVAGQDDKTPLFRAADGKRR